jgi:hypothetical protein
MRFLVLAAVITITGCDTQADLNPEPDPQTPQREGDYRTGEKSTERHLLDDGRVYQPRHRWGITIDTIREDSLFGEFYREMTFVPSDEDFPEQRWVAHRLLNYPEPRHWGNSVSGIFSEDQVNFEFTQADILIECSGSLISSIITTHCLGEGVVDWEFRMEKNGVED